MAIKFILPVSVFISFSQYLQYTLFQPENFAERFERIFRSKQASTNNCVQKNTGKRETADC